MSPGTKLFQILYQQARSDGKALICFDFASHTNQSPSVIRVPHSCLVFSSKQQISGCHGSLLFIGCLCIFVLFCRSCARVRACIIVDTQCKHLGTFSSPNFSFQHAVEKTVFTKLFQCKFSRISLLEAVTQSQTYKTIHTLFPVHSYLGWCNLRIQRRSETA